MSEPWSVDDRLRRARQEFRRRQPAHPALVALDVSDRRPMGSATGAVVEVDSFLSSLNSDRVADGYPPAFACHVSVRPLHELGRVEVRLRTETDLVEGFECDGSPVGEGHDVSMEHVLEAGERILSFAAVGAGYRGSPAQVTLALDPDRDWPDGLTVSLPGAGHLAVSRVPFRPEAADHPEVEAIRELLAEHGVGPGATDLETAIVVRQWVKSLWDHQIPRRSPPYNGRLILDRALRQVDTFICMHYSVAFVHACASLGLPARVVNLHRHVAETSGYVLGEEGSHSPPIDEHVTAEVWCRDLGAWVMMDTDFDCHYLRDGRPQSAWEIHTALLDGALDTLQAVRGPGSAAYDALGPGFFTAVLPTYYRHVSLLMRSDFISDPDGPVPILHLTDDRTPDILWHDGEDLRLHPHLMGPVVVARRQDHRTGLLTDGGLAAAWASSDDPVDHWVDASFPRPVTLGGIGLSWPEFRGYFATSREYRVIGRRPDGAEVVLAEISDQRERPCSRHDFPAEQVAGVRLHQPSGGGSTRHAQRLWLAQVEFFAPPTDG